MVGVGAWREWWALFQNEWLKFRRRRRVWIAVGSVVLLVGVIAVVVRSPSPGTRSDFVGSDRFELAALHRQLRTAHGAARVADRAQLLLTRYDLAELTHHRALPLAPIVRATAAWVRAAAPGRRATDGYSAAIQAWQESRFALARHLPLEPQWVPPSGLVEVSQVMGGNWVALFSLLVLLLTADVLGMELATHTWNRVWLDPPPRMRVLLAKSAFAAAVAVGVVLMAAVLLYVAGTLRYGSGVDWATVETHYQAVSVYYPSLHARLPLYAATAPADAAGVSLMASDVWAVVGSLLPLLSVVGVAALLGYAIAQPTIATLLAAGFAVTPTLMGTGNTTPPGWLPGTYLDMGQVAMGTGPVVGDSVWQGILVSAVWLVAAWLAVALHQRRAEL